MLIHKDISCRAKFFDAGGFTDFVTQIVKFGTAHHTATDNFDSGDTGAVDREDTFNALTGLNPADGESFFDTAAAAGDHGALEILNTFGVAFDDLNRDTDGITDIKLEAVFLRFLFTNSVNYVHLKPLSLPFADIFPINPDGVLL
jgi:hypothetical protein